MSFGRAVISSMLAISLTACGGGGNSGSSSTSSGGVGSSTSTSSGGTTTGGTGGTACTLASRQQFVRDVLNEWYLFPELLNLSANPASYTTVQDYIDALVAPARAQSKDRFFTYITSIAEENAAAAGAAAGFGVRFGYDTTNNRVFVIEAYENAPAFPAGIDRGTELISINGQSVATLMSTGGPSAVINALGPPNPGLSRTLGIRDPNGTERTVTVTKADYNLDPISDRYGVRVLDNGGTKVGYLNLRTFFSNDADRQLREAFDQFRAQGINQVILDFRYNGGGFTAVAETMGDLLLRSQSGKVFSRMVLRPSKSAENETRLIAAQPQSIDAMKVAVIGTGGTASASEFVPNSLIPYLGTNLALVGSNTFGKPVGQFAFDRSTCDDRLRAVAFKTVNANGQGEYFTGLASVMPVTCRANDDIRTPLGDPNEASVRTALDFLAGRSCTAIAQSSDRSVQSVGGRNALLQPERPSALQENNPGLF